MPAPLAKGLIISFSLLFAAGLAVYENPHVRRWVDDSRRKVAIALHSLGDELAPPSEQRDTPPDVSTREDEASEAVERRRRARQEILERGKILDERRRSQRIAKSKGRDPDEILDKEVTVKNDPSSAITTAAESQSEESGLRHRHTESQAAAFGSVVANPFADEVNIHSPITLENQSQHATDDESPTPLLRETGLQLDAKSHHAEQVPVNEVPSRSSTPTLSTSPMSPPVPPKPAAYQPHRLLIDTEEVSNHPSESLVDLTPTTSTSSAHADLAELDQTQRPLQSSYWSVNEWAQNSVSPEFYSPPRSVIGAGIDEPLGNRTEGLLADHYDNASRIGSEYLDLLSDDGAPISTPGSWSEVASQVSEDT